MARRELLRHFERRLAEQVEEAHAGLDAEGLAQALGGICDCVVAHGRDRGQIGEQRVYVAFGLHDDVTMTSFSLSVKCQTDGKSAPYARR